MKAKTTHKLKCCPFCGGQAIIQEMYYSMLQNEHFVKCTNCGAESGRYYKGTYDAVKAWNRRFNNENDNQNSNS